MHVYTLTRSARDVSSLADRYAHRYSFAALAVAAFRHAMQLLEWDFPE